MQEQLMEKDLLMLNKDIEAVRKVQEVFSNFVPNETVTQVSRMTSGTVNQTYRVITRDNVYICQQINSSVFGTDLGAMEQNYIRYCDAVHVIQKEFPRWQVPCWCRTGDDRYFYEDQGEQWMAYPYIPGKTITRIQTEKQVRSFSEAVSILHYSLNYFEGIPEETIKGFHDMQMYYEQYCACEAVRGMRDAYCDRMIKTHRKHFQGFTFNDYAKVIHGDTKLGNVIFDANDLPVSMIDLNTFSYRSRLMDIADSIRSIADRFGDISEDEHSTRLNEEAVLAFIKNYRDSALYDLSGDEEEILPLAAAYMPFELGLRFYTDFLRGNIYFKTTDDLTNLRRARCQFALFQEMAAPAFQKAMKNAVQKKRRQMIKMPLRRSGDK